MDAKYRDIILSLSEIYKPEGVLVWLFSPHKLLGGRIPVEAIYDGQGKEVAALVDSH